MFVGVVDQWLASEAGARTQDERHWIAQLLQYSLLKASLIPRRPAVRVARFDPVLDVTR
jgi:hypothetical protein